MNYNWCEKLRKPSTEWTDEQTKGTVLQSKSLSRSLFLPFSFCLCPFVSGVVALSHLCRNIYLCSYSRWDSTDKLMTMTMLMLKLLVNHPQSRFGKCMWKETGQSLFFLMNCYWSYKLRLCIQFRHIDIYKCIYIYM